MNPKFTVSKGSWETSPCSSCSTSPCCTRLPLHRFHIEKIEDFEWAERAVRHPRIELGLYGSGWWMAYYLAPCRFLNPIDSKCLIHGSDRQPQVCQAYSPVRCWYKRVFVEGGSPDFVRFNAGRLSMLAQMIRFDDAGELESAPSWEEMKERIETISTTEHRPEKTPIEQYAPLEPAGLFVPLQAPRHRRDIDLVRFRLGFHGVSLGRSAADWAVIIGNPPEALAYRTIAYEQLDLLLGSVVYDAAGKILSLPPAEGLPEPSASPTLC
ncbi:MAG TPA: hypothetical protein VMW69_09365 [Spirochaetia bacterium]|nr:hypothetical protein [Spirochaetia bacterium]